MYDLIIVGGGAAGCAAGIYAQGKQLNYVLIRQKPGRAGRHQQLAGQVEPEYLAGENTVRVFEQRLSAEPDRILEDQVTAIDLFDGIFQVTTAASGELQAAAVIMATGAATTPLDVPGAAGLVGHGLGYSITTHAHLLANKRAAVVGQTVRALRGIAELARSAEKVYALLPDTTPELQSIVEALQAYPAVEVLASYRVQELVGVENVVALLVAGPKEVRQIKVDAVFVDLGLKPNSDSVRGLVALDEDGFIIVDQEMATNVPGLFAAGDVTTAFGEQILIAIGDGARAALSAYDFILSRPPQPESEGESADQEITQPESEGESADQEA